MIKVIDNWYPNFPGNEIEVTYWPGDSRIVLSGADDFMLERHDCDETLYQKIINSKSFSKDIANQLGFDMW